MLHFVQRQIVGSDSFALLYITLHQRANCAQVYKKIISDYKFSRAATRSVRSSILFTDTKEVDAILTQVCPEPQQYNIFDCNTVKYWSYQLMETNYKIN